MYICKSSLNDCGLSYLVLLTMLPVPHNPTVKVCSSFDDKRMDFQTVLNTSFVLCFTWLRTIWNVVV